MEANLQLTYIDKGLTHHNWNLTEQTLERIAAELEDIVISQAPIPVSEEVRRLIMQVVFAPKRAGLEQALMQYASEHTLLHAEGYVTFRMQEHQVKMYAMLCALLKPGPR